MLLSRHAFTSDTCNAIQKILRILVELIVGSYDYGFNTELTVCKHRKETHELSKHPFPVIVGVGHQQPKIMCKCINLCNCNNQRSQQRPQPVSKLPQGPRVRVNFSRVDERKPYRWAVASCWWAAGSQQDLCTDGCMAIYMNYPYYIEFLNSSQRKLRKNNKAHILQQNLFVAIKASEFIVLAWLLSILHLSICMTGSQLTRWTRQWVKHRSPGLILDEKYIMGIFDKYLCELPPFQEYWEETFR